MKHLHKFNNQQEFNEAYSGSEYVQPWVSYTVESEKINYNKYSKEHWKLFSDPFTIEALGSGEITWALGSKTASYSKNNGNVQSITSNTTIPVVEGDVITFKGNNTDYADCAISSTANFNVKGNIMSLTNEENYATVETISNSAFIGLFKSCTTIISASNLILPVFTLSRKCYKEMFSGCINLIDAPELPAKTLNTECYRSMFSGCASLINAPSLPATTIASSCYHSMFLGCTSLTSAPELPAESIGNSCYMTMFKGCTNLVYIKCLATTGTMPANGAVPCTSGWLSDASSTGTFVKANATVEWERNYGGIPVGWTVKTADSEN